MLAETRGTGWGKEWVVTSINDPNRLTNILKVPVAAALLPIIVGVTKTM
jgi:hypothetical protein